MNLGLLAFYLLGVLSLGAGVGAVTTRNVTYAVLFLLVSLLGVAGLFILLVAEFLALVQVLIYGGAITVVLLFAIMLTRAEEFAHMRDNPRRPWALVAAVGVFGVLVAAILLSVPATGEPVSADFSTLGRELFSVWAIPFEVASLVLLVALMGAILIARRGGEE